MMIEEHDQEDIAILKVMSDLGRTEPLQPMLPNFDSDYHPDYPPEPGYTINAVCYVYPDGSRTGILIGEIPVESDHFNTDYFVDIVDELGIKPEDLPPVAGVYSFNCHYCEEYDSDTGYTDHWFDVVTYEKMKLVKDETWGEPHNQ